MSPRRPLTVAVATAALVAVTVLPAAAHPFFRGGATVSANSLATVTLAMAHGCGTEEAAGGDPTTEVSVEIPAEFSYVEAFDADGYEVSVEEGDRPGVPEVVTWTATDGGEPAPDLEMEIVVDGEAGDEVYVRVFQGCDDFAYRWVGTPDDPADDPAVRLTLAEENPDAPPPPAPEETVTPGAEEDADEPQATDDGAADDATDAAVDGDVPPEVEELPTEPPEDDPGDDGFGWPWLLLGAIVIVAAGALIGTRLRRPVPDPAAGDGTGMSPPNDEV